jgi:signal transduction histidine kinase
VRLGKLTSCSLVCAAAGMMCSVPYILRSGTALFPWGWMASALYLGSAAAGAAQILIRDRNDRQLLAELQEHVAALTHGELPLPQTVAAAARKLVDATEQALFDLRTRTRELELQLGVADAARSHAETILEGIANRDEEVSEMKNAFVSMVSHELRTPLASIKAYIEMLIDGEAQDVQTQGEFFEVIQNEANRLGRLIDNILNISRIEAGVARITFQRQCLQDIVSDALKAVAPQAELKKIRISEHLDAGDYQTSCDREMIYQAVLNLLSNAVKFTPGGGAITVESGIASSRNETFLRITDTGVGIAPKDLPFVFDKFYRAESGNQITLGTGLGLSLVRHIVQTVHRGRVFATSELGRGSCFGFELALDAPKAPKGTIASRDNAYAATSLQ